VSTVRERRLLADADRVRALVAANPDRLELIQVEGRPPTRYVIELRCRSVVSLGMVRVQYGDVHQLAIELPPDYPLGSPPRAKVLTPIRHPHVFRNTQEVCIGYKRLVTEFLDAFVCRMYDLLRYDPKGLDPRSPADYEAMQWALHNKGRLPLDSCALRMPGQEPERPAIVWKDLQ